MEEKEKKEFFNVLRNIVKKYKEIIMMGDFNTVFSKQDRLKEWFSKQIREGKN